jgi:glutaredoxin
VTNCLIQDTTRVQDILSAHKIAFELLDVTQENNLDEMFKVSGKKVLPQIFVDGVFKGLTEQFDEANEDGKVLDFLK